MTPAVGVLEKAKSLADIKDVYKKARNKKKYADRNTLAKRRLEVILNWITNKNRQKGDIDQAVDSIVAHSQSLKDNNDLEPGSIIYAVLAYIEKYGERTPFVLLGHHYRNYYYEIDCPDDRSSDCVNILKRDDKVLIEIPSSF